MINRNRVHTNSILSISHTLTLSILLLAGCLKPTNPKTEIDLTQASVIDQFTLDEPSDDWTMHTPALWRIAHEGDRRLLQMAIPPERPFMAGVRRPQEYTLYNKYQFRSFSMSCGVRVDRDVSVTRRDAVVIFGWQDKTHFYYAHLAGATDEWHNALVRVDGETRQALVPATQRPKPTMTDKEWHKVDVIRDANSGSIKVYVDAYDESVKPVFDVIDKTYDWGYLGLGSFDDHASFAKFRVEGEARKADKPIAD